MSASINAPMALPVAEHFTPTAHSDVYPAISPVRDLAGSAKNLSVLITGAGRGYGRAAAIAFAQAGAAKVVLMSRSQGQLDEVESAMKVAAGRGKAQIVKVVGDVTKREDVERIFDKAGNLNVLINNSGVLEPAATIHESDPDTWWNTQEVNIKGTYLPTREFLRRNLGHRLTIINTSSIGSIMSRPGLSSYQPSKSFINRFTEFLHFEYQARDVRTFAYHPGDSLSTLVVNSLEKSGMSKISHDFFRDTPELGAGFLLWLATQGDKIDFLRGRYLSATWDVDELLEKKEEIEKKGLLWTRVVGQEQGIDLVQLPW